MIQNRNTSGFTLFEMMVLIAVLGIVLGILIPNITDIKNRSRDEELASELESIALSLENYKQICKTYPSSWTRGTKNTPYDVDGTVRPCSVVLGNVVPKNLKRIKDPFDGKISYVGMSYPVSTTGRFVSGNCSKYRLGYQMSSENASPILRSKKTSLTNTGSDATIFVDCGPMLESLVPPRLNNYYYIEPQTGQ